MFRFHSIMIALLCLGGLITASISVAKTDTLSREDHARFIDRMVQQHRFDRQQLETWFAQVKPRPDIIEAISNPAESLPWHRYRKIFLTQSRIEEGVQFWQQHQQILAQAEETFGVPASIMVAVFGVETRYGKHKGRYPVMDALVTLAFDYPKRAKFFTDELEQFLLLSREEQLIPLTVLGSYAGAMGGPQFISSSYRRYAVDFDQDGQRDLWQNNTDIIGSIANYFKVHHWKPGQPIVVPARVTGARYKKILDKNLKPKYRLQKLGQLNIQSQKPLSGDPLVKLLAMEGSNGTEFWLGLHNFYVITRYNHSPLYALAVFQLSQEIEQLRANSPQ